MSKTKTPRVTVALDSPLARAVEEWADFAPVEVKAATADGITRGTAWFEDGGVITFIVRVPLDGVTAADLNVRSER